MTDPADPAPAESDDDDGNVTINVDQPGNVTWSGSEVTLLVTQRWEAISLALFGVIWGIVVTVAGVAVAILAPRWPWLLAYAVLSLGVLVLALVIWPQPFRTAMRWVRDRGDTTTTV